MGCLGNDRQLKCLLTLGGLSCFTHGFQTVIPSLATHGIKILGTSLSLRLTPEFNVMAMDGIDRVSAYSLKDCRPLQTRKSFEG